MSNKALAEAVDYNLSAGIEVMERRFEPGPHLLGMVTPLEHIPVEEYSTPCLPDDPDVVAIREQLSDEKTHFGGENGRKIGYSVLNEDADSDETTLFLMNWGGFRGEGAIRELAGMLRRNPSERIIVPDYPGRGLSDPFSRADAQEIAQSGRHTVFAEIMLGGLGRVFEDYAPTRVRARSEGGLVGLELAPLLDKPVSDMSVFDSPGSRMIIAGKESSVAALQNWRLYKGMWRYFMNNEGAHARAYADLVDLDPEAATLRAESLKKTQIALNIGKVIQEGTFVAQCVLLPLAMAQGKLGEIVQDALPHVKHNLTYISPVFSALNYPWDVSNMFSDVMQDAEPDLAPKVVRQLVINGTHAFGTGTPDALTAVEDRALAA